MLRLDDVITAFKDKAPGYDRTSCDMLDDRDVIRLTAFMTGDQVTAIGFRRLDDPVIQPWTEEAVIKELVDDAQFGLEKAENQRGISASLMFEVVQMWLWILEDHDFDAIVYADYGNALHKAVLAKYAKKEVEV